MSLTLLMVPFGNTHVAAGAGGWRALCGRDLAHTAGADRIEGYDDEVTCQFCGRVLAGGAGDLRFKAAPR